MLDLFADFFLKFGHVTFIFPLVVLGMIFHRRELYVKALCLLLFVMIFNTLLKQLFKIPLFPHLGPGYAFPSGHMHAATIFYGYILYRVDNKIVKTILALAICALGFSLIHCHFHDLFDVLGAVVFSIIELYLYRLILLNFGEKGAIVAAIAGSLLIMMTLVAIYKMESHVYLAFNILVATIFSASFIKDTELENLYQKFLALGMTVALAAIVYCTFIALFSKELLMFIPGIQSVLMPVIIIGSINICSRFKFRHS